MRLAPGDRLGPYEIVPALGVGGMGEVYKATDTRLGRGVAIKILPGADPDLIARFDREARAVAALAHPHICALYDVGSGFDTKQECDVVVLKEGRVRRQSPAQTHRTPARRFATW